MGPSSTRPTNKLGRHILPERRPRAVDTAQRPSSPFGVSSPYEVSMSCRTALEDRASQPQPPVAAPGPINTRAMAVLAPESAPMERRASKPYINDHSAPPYSTRKEAIEHQSATIAYIEQQSNSYMNLGPRLNTTDAVYTTDDANKPSGQRLEPEDSTRPGQAGTGTSSPLEPSRIMEAVVALFKFSQKVGVFGPDRPQRVMAQPEAWREMEAARTLLQFSQNRPQRAMAQPEPSHGSPATRSLDEALAPGESTKEKLEVPQQGQGQAQQEPRDFKRTGEDDGHTDGSASSVVATSGSRSPRPSSKPQLQRKRKRVQEKEETGTEKKSETKKSAKAKRTKPNEEKERKFVCHCGKGFTRNDHLTRHIETVHGIEIEGDVYKEMYQCDICGKLHTRKDNHKGHRDTLHPEAGPAPVPKSVFVVVHKKSSALVTANGQTSGSSSPLKQDHEGEEIQKANKK